MFHQDETRRGSDNHEEHNIIMRKVLFLVGIFLVLTIIGLASYGIYWKRSKVQEIRAFHEVSGLEIGRMKVSIWPEYDEPQLLVIYEGRFKDPSRFPSKARFIVPKGAEISDACSPSPQGGHFCQLFDVENRGNSDEVSLRLPYNNFFLSFYYNPLKGGEVRDFVYPILSNYPVDVLEVNIQEPLRSTGFRVDPKPMRVSSEKGFKFFHYGLSIPQKDKDRAVEFNISYAKKGNKPSVNIKYSDYGLMDEKLAGVGTHKILSALPIMKTLFVLGILIFAFQIFRLYRR